MKLVLILLLVAVVALGVRYVLNSIRAEDSDLDDVPVTPPASKPAARKPRRTAAKKADPDGEKNYVTAEDEAAAAKAAAKEGPKRKPRRKPAAKTKADPTPRKTTKAPSKKDL